jgi:hypothetical protein
MAKRRLAGGLEVGLACSVALALAGACGGKNHRSPSHSGPSGESGASSGGESTGRAGDSGQDSSGGKSSGGSGHGDNGASGSGATEANERAGNGSEQATGGTGPTGGVGPTGGTPTGGTPTGGTSPTGGVPPTGGTSPTGGAWPIGGAPPDTGTVGAWCDTPGALQCAGHRQRVIVVCGGENTWDPFQTCEVGQFCDTRDGDTLGSCQDPYPGCDGRQAGDLLCKGADVYACGPDTITVEPVEQCDEYCVDGGCADPTPCSTVDDWVNCARDCSGRDAECQAGVLVGTYRVTVGAIEAIRMPAAIDVATCDNGRRYAVLEPVFTDESTFRFNVNSPWLLYKMSATEDADPPCTETAAESCAILTGSGYWLAVYTDEAGAPPADLHVQQADAAPVCPVI